MSENHITWYATKNIFVKRSGRVYRVIAEVETEVMVEAQVLYADGTYHLLNMWWDKKLVVFCKTDGTPLPKEEQGEKV